MLSEILDFWVKPITEIAAILLPIVFYFLVYRYPDKRTTKHRRLRKFTFMVLIIIALGNAASLMINLYSIWAGRYALQADVTPKTMSTDIRGSLSSRRFVVTNRSDSTIHQVWVKICIRDSTLHWDDIEIEPQFEGDQNVLAESDGKKLIVFSEVWGLGAVDSTGEESLWLILRSILPRVSLSFNLIIPTIKGVMDRSGYLQLQVKSHSAEPMPMMDVAGGAGPQIVPPENMTLLGICSILSVDQKSDL